MKKIFFLTFFCSFTFVISSTQMNLYAMYTPSHEILVRDWFLPSLTALDDDIEIILTSLQQECPTASFKEDGWVKTTRNKADIVLKAIEENWGKIFIFSDVDIQFFAPFREEILNLIKEKDMVIQRNHPNGTLCSGFFACKGNEKTYALWKQMKKSLYAEAEKERPKKSDQNFLNFWLRRSKEFKDLKWDYLPNTFMAGGTFSGTYWKPGKKLFIPEGIFIHHANYTRGIANKIEQLKYVNNKVNSASH